MALIVRESGQGSPAGLEGHPLYLPDLWATLHPQGRVFDLLHEAGGGTAVAALAILDRPRRWLMSGPATLTVPFAPYVRDDDPGRAADFCRELVALGRERGCRQIVLNWCYGSCDALEACRPLASAFEPEVEFFLNLMTIDPAFFERYEPGGKHYARAQRDGLSIRTGGTWEDLLALRALQTSSSARSAERNNPYELPEERYYRQVFDACLKPGHSRILFAVKDGRDISGLMFLVHAGRCVVQRGGSSAAALAVNGSRYAHGMLLRHLRSIGCRDVYFGGVPTAAREAGHPEHGLYEFKKGWPAAERSAFHARIELG